jgi:hypothetical protein
VQNVRLSDMEAGYMLDILQWRDGLASCGNISCPGIALEQAQISEQVTSRPLARPFLRSFCQPVHNSAGM